MKEVMKLADFSGKTIFCGADVPHGSWSICLMMEERILKRFSQFPRGEVLEKTLKWLLSWGQV